jgi:hypothetical protein
MAKDSLRVPKLIAPALNKLLIDQHVLHRPSSKLNNDKVYCMRVGGMCVALVAVAHMITQHDPHVCSKLSRQPALDTNAPHSGHESGLMLTSNHGCHIMLCFHSLSSLMRRILLSVFKQAAFVEMCQTKACFTFTTGHHQSCMCSRMVSGKIPRMATPAAVRAYSYNFNNTSSSQARIQRITMYCRTTAAARVTQIHGESSFNRA